MFLAIIISVVAICYGLLKGNATSGSLKRYIRCSCYVVAVLLVCGLVLTYVTYRSDPVRNAEWMFGVGGAIWATIVGWASFSLGYTIRFIVSKRSNQALEPTAGRSDV